MPLRQAHLVAAAPKKSTTPQQAMLPAQGVSARWVPIKLAALPRLPTAAMGPSTGLEEERCAAPVLVEAVQQQQLVKCSSIGPGSQLVLRALVGVAGGREIWNIARFNQG